MDSGRAMSPRPFSSVVLFLAAGAAAFLLFVWVGGQDFLFHTYDHWITGQAMLLSDGYLHAGFRTPLLFPVEDVRGPIGNWSPYVGFPPLFFLGLAVWRGILGPSLATARVLFCLLTGISAALLALIAWRITRELWVTLLAVLIFCLAPMVLEYCSLGFCETPALTWSLLLILLYPSFIGSRSAGWRVGYWALVGAGCLLSWHCFVVPVACAATHAFLFRRDLRRNLVRYTVPVVIVGGLGVVLIAAMRYLEGHYELNGWYSFPPRWGIMDKLFFRTGWLNPRESLQFILGTANWTAAENAFVVFPLFALLALLTVCSPPATPGPARENPPENGTRAFYLTALFAFPLSWLLFMPQMNTHVFERMYWIPFIAASCAVLLRTIAQRWGKLLGALCGAVMVMIVLARGVLNIPQRHDAEIFRNMEKDVRTFSDADTVICMEFDDRGAWWRVGHSVVGFKRLHRAQGRKHLLVVFFHNESFDANYRELARQPAQEWGGYRILAPR